MPLKGTVLMGGKAINLKKDESLSLKFMWTSTDGREMIASANAKSDGTFVVQGPLKKGLPPGDYKITVKWTVRTKDEEAELQKEVFKETPKLDEQQTEQLGDKSKTPLTVTIDSTPVNELVIDIGPSPSVTKK